MSNKCPNCGGPTIPGFHYKNYCKAECDLKGKPEYWTTIVPPVVIFRTFASPQQGTFTIPANPFVPGAIKYAQNIALHYPIGYRFRYGVNNLHDTQAQADAKIKNTLGAGHFGAGHFGTGEVKLLKCLGKSPGSPVDVWEVELIWYP